MGPEFERKGEKLDDACVIRPFHDRLCRIS